MPTSLRAAAFLFTSLACSIALAAETKEVTIEKLKFNVPTSWQQEQPSNSLRLGQFKIPAAEGDSEGAELYVSTPIGGSAKANIQRWINQFQASGRELKMTKGTCPQGEYVFVELSGTYNKPDGPPVLQRTKPVEGYRMMGVMLTVQGGGNYFIRVTGPDKTVKAQADAFRDSFGAKASGEMEYSLE